MESEYGDRHRYELELVHFLNRLIYILTPFAYDDLLLNLGIKMNRHMFCINPRKCIK